MSETRSCCQCGSDILGMARTIDGVWWHPYDCVSTLAASRNQRENEIFARRIQTEAVPPNVTGGGIQDPADIYCTLSAPGRGDCRHFIGIPAVWDATTTDAYGRPHGWCFYCFGKYESDSLRSRLTRLETAARAVVDLPMGTPPTPTFAECQAWILNVVALIGELRSTLQEG